MKTILMTGAALIFAGGLGANTAFAATNAMAAGAAPVTQTSQAAPATGDHAGHPITMRQQIQAQLSQDGYTAIDVVPSSFYVHAKDKNGNPVAMVIGPDSFTEVTDVASKQVQAAAPAGAVAPAAKTTTQ